MLVSHRRKFIYLKTHKTAGTSVEAYFERECVDDPERHKVVDGNEQIISPSGIIGARAHNARLNYEYYKHMPARELAAKLDPHVWSSYFKFCCVRNTFDAVVSLFWFELKREQREELGAAPFSHVVKAFKAWLLARDGLPDNSNLYVIGGRVIVDAFIRYESLMQDLEKVCERIGVKFEPERLGFYKSEHRRSRAPYEDYYDRDTAGKVRRLLALEIDIMGYKLETGGLLSRVYRRVVPA